MKRIFACILLVCLLLIAGCKNPAKETTPSESTAPEKMETQATIPTTQPATLPATEPATEPAPTHPATVTVYLLERTDLFDSGYTVYTYDSNYNILSYSIYTIENDLMYQVHFENPDANGMPCLVRTDWGDGAYFENVLIYSPEGKLLSEKTDDTSIEYVYDEEGSLAEKKEYYEGALTNVTLYEHVCGLLQDVYSQDGEGNLVFEAKVDFGRIIEKTLYSYGDPCTYLYEYDNQGNLISSTLIIDGEEIPDTIYRYVAVEVPYKQAQFLLEQQKYLLNLS